MQAPKIDHQIGRHSIISNIKIDAAILIDVGECDHQGLSVSSFHSRARGYVSKSTVSKILPELAEIGLILVRRAAALDSRPNLAILLGFRPKWHIVQDDEMELPIPIEVHEPCARAPPIVIVGIQPSRGRYVAESPASF